LKLLEYEAKNILSKYGIPVPQGGLATDTQQAREVAAKLKLPAAVKAQVLVAGRAKAEGHLVRQLKRRNGKNRGEIIEHADKGYSGQKRVD